MKLGVILHLHENIEEDFKKLHEMGFETCQLGCWHKEYFTKEYAQKIKKIQGEYQIEISALWCGWEPPAVWNFIDGPVTLGIVPTAYRYARTETLIKGGEFAKELGVQDIVTHAGFIPEDPNNPEYIGVVNALRLIAKQYKNNNQYFLFETGQETPITLKRVIEDVGADNLGINLDPANLLLYGKANPIDALDVFGRYVRGVHAKDGEYPVNGRELGEEKPIGKGRVNFPALIQKLKELGYQGAITIEREISGEQQILDIIEAKRFLEQYI